MTVLLVAAALVAGPQADGEAVRRDPCVKACEVRHRWRVAIRGYRGKLRRMAWCESTGRWHIATGNGYYGGLQFDLQTWQSVGGSGYPHHASRLEQMYRAVRLIQRRGYSPWPHCGGS